MNAICFSIQRFFEIVAERFIKFWAHADFIFRWTDLYKQQQKHLTNLHTLSLHVSEIGFIAKMISCFFLFFYFFVQFFGHELEILRIQFDFSEK